MNDFRQVIRVALLVGGLLSAPLASAQGIDPAPVLAATVSTLFAIEYHAGPKWKPELPLSKQGLGDHGHYWKALTEQGKVVAAGQAGPKGGLVILRAATQAEADLVVANDPAVKAGIFSGEPLAYFPRFVGKAPITPIAP